MNSVKPPIADGPESPDESEVSDEETDLTNIHKKRCEDTPLSPSNVLNDDVNGAELGDVGVTSLPGETVNKLANDSLSDISDLQDSFQSQSITDSKDRLADQQLDVEENFIEKEKELKRRSDEGLELRDEQLDFEEEKESGEEDGEEGTRSKAKIASEDREDGEISEEEEEDSSLRQEPKQVCRFFNKGQCTWGSNCRFLHPGVSDKGNYNMFAPQKPSIPPPEKTTEEKIEDTRSREVRRYFAEPTVFESAWERGLRYAKEMVKRASKRRETDADFEEKRFNLSLGQSELDRENDYYTRPASPVYKPVDEFIGVLDPYERQAIRHLRHGHFENLEVRYNVDPSFHGGPMRSRRDKFEREVTERIAKKRVPPPHPSPDPGRGQERRYPRPRNYKDEQPPNPPPMVGSKGPEQWADPWARNREQNARSGTQGRKATSRRSYSTGSSSGSSRSSRSRSSSYSSYSGSGSRSRSRSGSGSSRSSSSRSITPPVHPRQRMLQQRGRGTFRGGARGGYANMARNYPNSNDIPPGVVPIHPAQGGKPATGDAPSEDVKDPRILNLVQPKREPIRNYPDEIPQRDPNAQVPLLQPKIEPTPGLPLGVTPLTKKLDPRLLEPSQDSTTDMFGRNIPRKDVQLRPPTPPPEEREQKYRRSPSGSGSGSDSGSGSGSGSSQSRSRSRSRSKSGSGSGSGSGSSSRSSSSSSSSSGESSKKGKQKKVHRIPGTVSYGDSGRKVITDAPKVNKQSAAKPPLKRPAPSRPAEVTLNDDDSGESDTDARVLKRRKVADAPDPVPVNKPKPIASSATQTPAKPVTANHSAAAEAISKKPSASRREELLRQLRAVEDAIKKKRTK